MKKYLILAFLVVCIQTANAQKAYFSNIGNWWNVKKTDVSANPPFNIIYTNYSYTGAVVKNGLTYNILQGQVLGQDSALIREDTIAQKVYAIIYKRWGASTGDTTEKILYDYGLQTGDTFTLAGTPFSPVIYRHIVTTAGTIQINGVSHKVFYFSPIAGGFPYYVVEGIGNTTDPLFPYLPLVTIDEYWQEVCFKYNNVYPTIIPAAPGTFGGPDNSYCGVTYCLPISAAAYNVTDTSANLAWTGSVNANFQYSLQTNSNTPATGTNTTSSSYHASALTPNTHYYFFLRQICGSDTSSWSSTQFTTTYDTCYSPATLTVQDITDTSAIITWPPVAPALNYEWSLTNVSTPVIPGSLTTALSDTALALTPNTLYYFHLRTNCTFDSSWTSVSFTTTNQLSIDAKAGYDQLLFSPNPVRDVLIVNVNCIYNDGSTFDIYDLRGVKVKTERLNRMLNKVNVRDLTKGLYVIKCRCQNKTTAYTFLKE